MGTRVKSIKQTKQAPRAMASVFIFVSVFGFAQLRVTHSQNPATAETPPSINPVLGKYEGVAKDGAAEIAVTLEITGDQGKLSGRLVTAQGEFVVTEGIFNNGKLALKLDKEGTESKLTAQLQDDRLIGEWAAGGQARSVELKKIPTMASEASRVVAATAPTVSLTGDWDGLADAQGQGFPFVLTLKVEGEKVTGESSSSLGSATISNGSFKEGKLVFQLDSPGGSIYMSAVLKDGGLVGEFDYAGQSQGRWVAKKRNP